MCYHMEGQIPFEVIRVPFCGFIKEYALFDDTPVENLFIEEFMAAAPGDYVKVYLCGLMRCYHPQQGNELTQMARDLMLEDQKVLDAMQYWERQGLVRRVSDVPPSYAYINIKYMKLGQSKQDESLYAYRDFNNQLQQLFGSARLLHPQEFSRAYDWMEVFELPQEVVLAMVAHLIEDKGAKFRFATGEKTAKEWADAGIRTREDAERHLSIGRATTQAAERVLKQLGIRRAPTVDELMLAQKWTGAWGFDEDALIAACGETTSGRNPSMGYLDGVLKRLHAQGQHRADDIAAGSARSHAQDERVKAFLVALGQRGRAPTAADITLYEDALAQGFEPETLLLAAQQAARRSGRVEDAQRVLVSWQKRGLFTAEAAKAHLARANAAGARLGEIFEISGIARPATAADYTLLNKWETEWGLLPALVDVAAKYAAGANSPMPFIDRILTSWRTAGIVTVEAAESEHATGAQKPSPARNDGMGIKQSKLTHSLDYTQRQYAPGELDFLYYDLDKEGEA